MLRAKHVEHYPHKTKHCIILWPNRVLRGSSPPYCSPSLHLLHHPVPMFCTSSHPPPSHSTILTTPHNSGHLSSHLPKLSPTFLTSPTYLLPISEIPPNQLQANGWIYHDPSSTLSSTHSPHYNMTTPDTSPLCVFIIPQKCRMP